MEDNFSFILQRVLTINTSCCCRNAQQSKTTVQIPNQEYNYVVNCKKVTCCLHINGRFLVWQLTSFCLLLNSSFNKEKGSRALSRHCLFRINKALMKSNDLRFSMLSNVLRVSREGFTFVAEGNDYH